MAYNPQNPNGAAVSANSSPVAIATDQLGVAGSSTNIAAGASGELGWLSTIAQNASNVANNLIIGTQKTQLIDGSNNSVNTLSAGAGANGLLVAQGATNFTFSTLNSSTTQIASGTSFIGAIESVVSAPYASVILTSDQPGILTVLQYIGTTANTECISTSFATPAVMNGNCFGRSFAINGDTISVNWTNTGFATTTIFNLSVAYGNIPATTQLLNNPVAINEIAGVAISANTGLPVNIANAVLTTNDLILQNAQTTDGALSHFISGDPSGDLAGLNPIELMMDENSGFALSVRPRNPSDFHKVDSVNSIILSDAPAPIIIKGQIGTIYDIDTTGYQSIEFTSDSSATGTVTVTNNRLSTTTGVILSATSSSTWTNTIAVSTSYVAPVQARYTRITFTAAGIITAYLRNSPVVAPWVLNPFNLSQIGGSASLGAGYIVLGASASTNGQTVGSIIVSSTTPAATVIKASAGRLTQLDLFNGSSAVAFFHVYNATSVTLGTTAAIQVYGVPAGTGRTVILPDGGLYFSTGIAGAWTNLVAATDNTALTAAGQSTNYAYI